MFKPITILLLFVILAFDAFSQIEVKNDSLFVDSKPIAGYGISQNDEKGVVFEVRMLTTKLESNIKREFENQVRADLIGKPYIRSKRFYFEYVIHREMEGLNSDSIALQVLGKVEEAGILIEKAGKSYNGAIAISFISSAAGIGASFAGYPLAGTIVTIGGGFIAFIVHISANNKLIRGGKKLQQSK